MLLIYRSHFEHYLAFNLGHSLKDAREFGWEFDTTGWSLVITNQHDFDFTFLFLLIKTHYEFYFILFYSKAQLGEDERCHPGQLLTFVMKSSFIYFFYHVHNYSCSHLVHTINPPVNGGQDAGWFIFAQPPKH